MNHIHICCFFWFLLLTTGNSYSSDTEINEQAGGRRLTTTTTRREEQTQEPALDQQQQKTSQDGFQLSEKSGQLQENPEQLEPADELNHSSSSSSSSSQNERGRRDGVEYHRHSKQTLINFSSASSTDPLGHLQSSRPLPSSKSKKKSLILASSVHKFIRSLFVLFTTRNPIWSLSFMLVKAIFSCSFRIFYATVAALFGFLTHLMVWFWDEILFPMTFPIRLVFWMLITQPLNLSKTILKKLKPVILFLLSAIGIGVLIGMVGSSTHLRIGNWLFPLHHSHATDKKNNPQKNKKTRKSGMLGPSDRGLAKRPEADPADSAIHTAPPELRRPAKESPQQEEVDKKKKPAGLKETRLSTDPDDLTMPEEEEEEEEGNWMSSKRETELSSALEPNQTRYTSAVHQKLFSQPSSSTRHRHLPHHPSSSSSDDDDPPVSSSPSSSLTSPPKRPHHSLSSSAADFISILKSSPPPSSSTATSPSFTPSRKKKVTFKTD